MATAAKVLERANLLVSKSNFRKGQEFISIDELKLAAFSGMFTKLFQIYFPEEHDHELEEQAGQSKRELTTKIDFVLSKLHTKLPPHMTQVDSKEIMSGKLPAILKAIDAFLYIDKNLRYAFDALQFPL